ncbi:hypothetical protein SAMN06295885_3490 [Rathayibacter oskolensis]|uniref:Uncharacterized protein n=1 Tax=Rathayibacter oskolensis TaxID=1891671 RepID=A0A1X7PI08_9MICO|nr:hypothetical protein [Rathayibacter oskolensis]SMH50249.1 hypothetical protein SAMN06295885_3490 [Rathayibacter oskolensis]
MTPRDRARARRPGTELWAPDFLELSGSELSEPERAESSFECSTTRDGVTGALCVTGSTLVLSDVESTVRLRARDIFGWWDTPAGGTFSLAVEAGARHTVVLLSEFRGATVHAMTRAFGPGAPLDRLSA